MGIGLRKINCCRRVLFQVTFKTKRFCTAFFLFPYEYNDKNYGKEREKKNIAFGLYGCVRLPSPPMVQVYLSILLCLRMEIIYEEKVWQKARQKRSLSIGPR